MSSTIPFTGRRACTRSIQRPLRSASAERLAAWVSTSVSNRPIWLVEAACSATARPPTTQRMAGSCPSRSASFTSSYPAKRPNTDWRNCPSRVWRPFAPVRVSVRTSAAVSLRQRASSSSRQASRPPSDVTFVPWNSSLRRRSNVRPSTAVCGSPNVASIRGTRYRPYPADNLSRTDAYCQCQTKVSGKCGPRAPRACPVRALPSRCSQDDASRHLARGHHSPQCDQQLSREGHDQGLARATTGVGRPRPVPLRQRTLLLMKQEAPGQLDHPAPHAGVARLGEPFLAPPAATLVG